VDQGAPPDNGHHAHVAQLRTEVREDLRLVRKTIQGVADGQQQMEVRVAYLEGVMSVALQGIREDVADVKAAVTAKVKDDDDDETGIVAKVGSKDARSLLMVIGAVLTAGVLGGGADTMLKVVAALLGLQAPQ
jgi:hypothetical protein